MVYVIIGALVLIALMPFSVRNKTKFKQEQIENKAAHMGIDLSFTDKQ